MLRLWQLLFSNSNPQSRSDAATTAPPTAALPAPLPFPNSLGWTGALTPQVFDPNLRYPRNASDVFHVTFLLRQVLIQDLIPEILDRAQYWPRVFGNSTNESKTVEEDEGGQLYLATPSPRGLPPCSIRTVIFTVTSRDQGFSWDRKWHGTYENSWTWFNAIVFEPDPYMLAKNISEYERLITNVHAGKAYKTHTKIWSRYADDELERKAIEEIQDGRQVGITAWARFGAWKNHVKDARIEFEVAAVSRG